MTIICKSLLYQNWPPTPGMKSWPSGSFSLQKVKAPHEAGGAVRHSSYKSYSAYRAS
jgi:hypothetical protein